MVAAEIKDWQREKDLIRQSAVRLFEAIRQANYEHPGDWQAFPATDVDYQVHEDAPAWMRWICQHFRTNPIVSVDLGELAPHTNGLPAVPYRLTLKDGGKLEGVLPMNYNARGKSWYGVEGIDWHLRPKMKEK